MIDDIVTRLRRVMSFEGGLNPVVDSLAEEAADMIEVLCEGGDALAESLSDARRRHPCDCADRYDGHTGFVAITFWEEVRRG